MAKDSIEENSRAVGVCVCPQLPRHCGSDCHGNRAGNAFGMSVSDKRRSLPLLGTAFQVVSEIRAQRSDAHRAAIAHRTLTAESICGRVTPLCPGRDLAHLDSRHLAVTAIRIALEAAGEPLCQYFL